ELIDESPWVGIGRGAFEPVFQRVHPASAFATYTHLENEYLQAVVDWGVPGALMLAFVAIWLVVSAFRRWRDGPLTAGALGALAVVLLQSNVDFGVEFLGLAVPATLVASTLVYVPLREATPSDLRLARASRIAHIVALLTGAVLLMSNATKSIAADHDSLEHDAGLARDDVERHPFDYYGYARLSEARLTTDAPAAIRLLNHAMRLHPTDPGLHVAAARILFDAGHAQQAAVEYADALPAARDPRRLLSEIIKTLSPDVAAAAIPASPDGVDAWLKLLDDTKRDDIAITWLERLVLLHPHSVHACDRLFSLATSRVDLQAIETTNDRCIDFQPSHEQRAALAKVLFDKHAYQELTTLLADVETWDGRSDEKAEAWALLCRTELALARFDDAKRCLRHLDATGIVSASVSRALETELERADELERTGTGSSD
ncbi:MAG TPA: hypothetical protein VH143_21125, partial [Kofleriaceae bacterium]|nr:hypothetical protein [Kofleriaceae bacterium]